MRHTLIAGLVAASLPASALAGAKVEINDDASLDLGFRLQSQMIQYDSDAVADSRDYKIRRGRLRLGATVHEKVSLFMQTEFAEGPGAGGDARVIDAFIKYKLDDWAQVIAGENMAPSLRQSTTSSGGLMAIDRTGLVYKDLTWGARAVGAFTNQVLPETDSGLGGDVGVRDMGLTLFGSGSLSDSTHLKYYVGTYDGASTNNDSERYTARVQMNFGDPEPGYYNLTTYHGGKETFGIGLAMDAQDEVAEAAIDGNSPAEWHDYELMTADLFLEQPMGPGALSAEAGWMDLDLGGGNEHFVNSDGAVMDGEDDRPYSATVDRVQGSGYYAQAGYTVGDWQPWVAHESWGSDADQDRGSYDATRVGITYLIDGHNANIKAGFEQTKAENAIEENKHGGEDTINAFVLGGYITY
ncbi:Phosphate-selective porin O and P [Thiohalospira halophila DSM 15071]|uniref:Phosphate-selective porin O and P n=1 Tax=Thiohalospira halophila DSM 15071 TaxID=1123397 RepID=A0A1I1NSS1_9GAMM|nr:porin [Thiohalospira halophila]SFC97823.1 Phosphate-selective porin O and P [Thiohalospira halophila DSM 15071]